MRNLIGNSSVHCMKPVNERKTGQTGYVIVLCSVKNVLKNRSIYVQIRPVSASSALPLYDLKRMEFG